MTDYRTLELETRRDVAVIWMNRSDVRNAFNDTMIGELSQALTSLEADDGIRAIVLAGRGLSFCAGADLHWMKKMAGYGAEQNYEDALGHICAAGYKHTSIFLDRQRRDIPIEQARDQLAI